MVTHKCFIYFKSVATLYFYMYQLKSHLLKFRVSSADTLFFYSLRKWSPTTKIFCTSQSERCQKTTKFCRYYRLFQNLFNAVIFMRSLEDWKSFQSCLACKRKMWATQNLIFFKVTFSPFCTHAFSRKKRKAEFHVRLERG